MKLRLPRPGWVRVRLTWPDGTSQINRIPGTEVAYVMLAAGLSPQVAVAFEVDPR